jgi:hypothetical protein
MAAGALWAQGTKEKEKAEAYPAHVVMEAASIGAEFAVRSFSGLNRTYVAPDHLVVEVAVYPKRPLPVAASHFSLRVNGKKERVYAQAPQFVAASLKYSDWTQRPTTTIGVGVGDAGVVIGPPRPGPRFPGDERDRQPPPAPRAPAPAPAGGYEKPEEMTAAELAVHVALPEGETKFPVAGYLYFPFKGKPGSIRKLELLYEGPAGSATLRLR